MRKISLGRKVLMGAVVLTVIGLTGVVASPGAVAKTRAVVRASVHARYTVCSHGCPYKSIQAAINAASPGADVVIGPGAYFENVTVSKPVTLQGSGPRTVLYPAISAPNPAGCSGSLCVGASNMILVQADNVTITHLRLEGSNPKLTSRVVAGGARIDARNGIIVDFNHAPGIFNNLIVSNVTVSDVYLRGIYASSGGTFNFNHDTVNNVQGSSSSRSRCSTSAVRA